MGVNLKEYKEEIMIYGVGSLEESLEVLYGNGGYVTSFNEKDFHWSGGLGSEEVITEIVIPAEYTEYIENPVEYLYAQGIKFKFSDITKKTPKYLIASNNKYLI